MLSIPVLLLTCRQDWTRNLWMIIIKNLMEPMLITIMQKLTVSPSKLSTSLKKKDVLCVILICIL